MQSHYFNIFRLAGPDCLAFAFHGQEVIPAEKMQLE